MPDGCGLGLGLPPFSGHLGALGLEGVQWSGQSPQEAARSLVYAFPDQGARVWCSPNRLGALYGLPAHRLAPAIVFASLPAGAELWETSAIGLLTRPTLLRCALEVSEPKATAAGGRLRFSRRRHDDDPAVEQPKGAQRLPGSLFAYGFGLGRCAHC
jgi:hypothetical protein